MRVLCVQWFAPKATGGPSQRCSVQGVRGFGDLTSSAFEVGAAPPEGLSCRAGLPTVDYVPVMGVMVWPEESWDSETSPPPRGKLGR
jgi:hypothetical protein